MSAPEIGTEEWLAATGGRLTPGQATALAAAGFAQLARERVSRSRGGTPRASEQAGRLDVARRELDGVLVTERQHVVDRQGETLLHHGCRTYLLGVLLVPSEVFGRLDQEACVVAALTHDDGLVHPTSPGGCFTADSADEAARVMSRLGAGPDEITTTRAAVISHFQPTLPPGASAEAHVVARGASADVMGFGLRGVDPGVAREIWQEWPDQGFPRVVGRLFKGERTRAPRTRAGVLSLSGMPYFLRSSR